MNSISELEKEERKREELVKKRIKRFLPNSCKDCPHLEMINDNTVRCSYMISDYCLLK